MKVEEVRAAVEQTGSIKKAAQLLGKSGNSLQWWLARNGYQVKKVATLVPLKRDQQCEQNG